MYTWRAGYVGVGRAVNLVVVLCVARRSGRYYVTDALANALPSLVSGYIVYKESNEFLTG